MDPIIRSAPVTTVRRSLGRPGSVPAPPALADASQDPAPAVAAVVAAPALDDVPVPLEPTPGELAARMAQESTAALARAHAILEQAEAQRRQWEAQEAEERAQIAAAHASLQQRERALQQDMQAHEKALRGAHESAARQGYEEGLARGTMEGRADADATVAARLEQLDALARAMSDESDATFAKQEDMLVEVIWTAICRIAGELAVSREGVLAMVRKAVGQVRDTRGLCIRLHPQDAAWLGANKGLGDWTLQADPGVLMGACIVDGAQGSLDARLELQLERLRAALLTARAGRSEGGRDDAGGQS